MKGIMYKLLERVMVVSHPAAIAGKTSDAA
jgi:hypothetical protein